MSELTSSIYISYSQLCVFASSLSQPFNNWGDRHFSQGFSWRFGSVSFRTLVEDGQHNVKIFLNEPIPALNGECIRALRVPFESVDGRIEIGSISDSTCLTIAPGTYALQIEFLDIMDRKTPTINLRINSNSCDFTILRADAEINTDEELDLLAEPAS